MDADKLIKALREGDFKVRDYSGRGMGDRRCVGVYLERGQSPFAVGAVAALALGEEVLDLGVRQDSMGMGVILYFPGILWPEGETDEDD